MTGTAIATVPRTGTPWRLATIHWSRTGSAVSLCGEPGQYPAVQCEDAEPAYYCVVCEDLLSWEQLRREDSE